MIRRIYVDNYKAAVNFELKPKQENLWFGSNGAGKTTVIEILALLRDFIIGSCRTNAFVSDTKTSWLQKSEQSFELDLQGKEGLFSYKLQVQLSDDRSRNRIISESLMMDNNNLYRAEIDDDNQFAAHLFNDNYKEGAVLGFDWTQSGLSLIQPRKDNNNKLIEFRTMVEQMIIARINPFSIEAECAEESRYPGYSMEKFVPWYNLISQEKQRLTLKLFETLSDVIPDFDSFSLIKSGEERKLLKACFIDKEGNEQQYRFDRLSDGQRVLIMLYSLIVFLDGCKNGFTIILDEPENFVSLEEIQPWLNELSDTCDEKKNQYILISHHPEALDQLARSNGVQFYRDGNASPIRTRKLPESDEPLSVSALIARGWLNE